MCLKKAAKKNHSQVLAITVSVWQIRALRHREIKEGVQVHTISCL